MFDLSTLAIVAGTFLLAGAVKGVIGLGLPTVSLALLTVALGLTEAMNLLIVPSLVTNIWQAAAGGYGAAALRRTWPFLAMAGVTVWLGAGALTRIDLAWLSALLGLLLAVYAGFGLTGRHFTVKPGQERWAGPLTGAVNGILTGMTGSFMVPGVMYLQALNLPRDMLIQAMGMLFTVSTLALALALGGKGLMTAELGTLSAAALLPAVIGMVAGQRIRNLLPDQLFRRVFFFSVLVLGTYIAGSALGAA